LINFAVNLKFLGVFVFQLNHKYVRNPVEARTYFYIVKNM